MTIERHATLSAFSKAAVSFLGGSFAGILLGVALGRWAGTVHTLLLPPVFIGTVIGTVYLFAFLVDLFWAVIPARCGKPGCAGSAWALGLHEYRCAACGTTARSTSTGGSGFELLAGRNAARIARALTFDRRGALSVHEPGREGALSDPPGGEKK